MLLQRLAALSQDQGGSFGPTFTWPLWEPIGGCEGSTIALRSGRLLFSGPSSRGLRVNMTVFESSDEGQTWKHVACIDPGPSAYSSLGELSDGDVGLLYERAPPPPHIIFVPHAITFVLVPGL